VARQLDDQDRQTLLEMLSAWASDPTVAVSDGKAYATPGEAKAGASVHDRYLEAHGSCKVAYRTWRKGDLRHAVRDMEGASEVLELMKGPEDYFVFLLWICGLDGSTQVDPSELDKIRVSLNTSNQVDRQNAVSDRIAAQHEKELRNAAVLERAGVVYGE
jgi:hypothetical protein